VRRNAREDFLRFKKVNFKEPYGMDLEEEKLKRRIEAHQIALNDKVNMLKARLERVKRMSDVKSLVAKQPGLVVAGSVLAGFLARKITSTRSRNHRSARIYQSKSGYYLDPPAVEPNVIGKVGKQLIAILMGVATRTAIKYFSEAGKNMLGRKSARRRAEQNFRGHP
jgi:hypothetical protein